MNTSTHYNLKLAEGTDLVNPLTVDVPNYQTIDSTMFANEQAGVGTATELKSGTIHAITRGNQNRNVFTFKSTSIFNTGDTFTVDGSNVTALYPDNSSLKDRCFIVGSEVLCLLDGSQLTVLTSYYPDADEVSYNNGTSGLSATNVQGAIDALRSAENITYDSNNSVKNKIDEFKVLTGTLSSVAEYSSPIQLPTGFTLENTIIASLQVKSSTNTWRTGAGAFGANFSRTFAQIMLDGSNNTILTVFNNESSIFGADFKILIKKI